MTIPFPPDEGRPPMHHAGPPETVVNTGQGVRAACGYPPVRAASDDIESGPHTSR
ncbi:hypothetical protein [uncultured Desulfovibrio sp.]|uniref:hypothetical protein n=1 Tax=uncultured Desulfovibrio sp. TaxID=167968 RepID=UPI0026317071|nr:hypothetical protein [uncultured Desulfovibrio sp.]